MITFTCWQFRLRRPTNGETSIKRPLYFERLPDKMHHQTTVQGPHRHDRRQQRRADGVLTHYYCELSETNVPGGFIDPKTVTRPCNPALENWRYKTRTAWEAAGGFERQSDLLPNISTLLALKVTILGVANTGTCTSTVDGDYTDTDGHTRKLRCGGRREISVARNRYQLTHSETKSTHTQSQFCNNS